MIKKILLALAALVVVFLVVAALQPADYRYARSTLISAPPAVVFAQVNDLRNWPQYSPWVKLDPAAKTSFEGPAAGTGAVFAWAGNSEVGEGRMTIVETRPDELVSFKLEFLKPLAMTASAEFAFKAEGGQTAVTWSMSGKNSLIGKAAGLFMNMDKMVGADFERGLASLKTLSEAAAKK
jgi:hypothetical protein